jgi:hypothetical protein
MLGCSREQSQQSGQNQGIVLGCNGVVLTTKMG